MTDLSPIIAAVRQAAELCRRIQHSHFVRSEKGANDPVTIADYGAQAILQRALSRAYPDDAIVSEEQGSQFASILTDAQRQEIVTLLGEVLGEGVSEADVLRWLDHGVDRRTRRTWVIDPVDGTKGFVAMRRYSICVGLLVDGEVAGGVMGAPGYPTPDGLGMLYYAGDGAACAEPMSGGQARRLSVSKRRDMTSLRVLESVEREHSDREKIARVRAAAGMDDARVEQLDSQEKYALVAAGEADVYMRLPRSAAYRHNIWDHAAGAALVQAAGGRVTGLRGEPLDFKQGPTLALNDGMVVSNGLVHDRLIDAIQRVMGTG